jgi:transcriptional regulator with AAA-type ATPase domain
MAQQLRLVFGTSRAIQQVVADCVRYAGVRYPLLILGARGTGKSVVARHIHALSQRAGDFIKESGAAIPEHLEVSHLAGHARGAFTGADSDRVGLLERAHRGTFFLDELALASGKVQQKADLFRRDLRDRFGLLVLKLPSLAERQDEILALADVFLQQEAAELGLQARPLLSQQVRDCFLAAAWAGGCAECA